MKEPLARVCHIAAVLGISHGTFNVRFANGLIPQPDLRGNGNGRAWKLSTLHAWNPQVGDAVKKLLKTPAIKIPAVAPRPRRVPVPEKRFQKAA